MENDQSKNQTNKSSRKKILIIFAVILLILFICIDYFYLIHKSVVSDADSIIMPDTSSTESTSNNFDTKSVATTGSTGTISTGATSTTPEITSNTGSTGDIRIEDSTDPNYYYNIALTEMSNKNYSNAIVDFGKAIVLDSKNPEYYSKKAEAEVLAGKKQDAIKTVQEGLINNPNDPTLKNKLDILQTVVK